MSQALEASIFVTTGADTGELIKGKKGKALDQNGQPYTEKFYQSWEKQKESYGSSSALKDFETLLADALRLGKLPAVLVYVQERFFDLKKFLREAETS